MSGEPWSTVRKEQKAFGEILCVLRSDWSLIWLDVCICTECVRKRVLLHGSAGCRELAPKVGGSWSGQGSREAPGPFVPDRVRFALSRQMSAWSVHVRTKMRCLLPEERESRGLFGSVVATSGPLGMEIGGIRCFLSRGKTKFLQARSICHAFWYAESCYPPGRLLILSDNLALVLALCKRRSKHFYMLTVMRRIFASGFRAGFVLHFRWIPSELNYSDEGSRFFDQDYDPEQSNLHVLAQRSPRFSPARTCDQDCLSPSLTHLDVGEGDRTSHIHLPSVTIQSNAPSDDLSACTGYSNDLVSRVHHYWED